MEENHNRSVQTHAMFDIFHSSSVLGPPPYAGSSSLDCLKLSEVSYEEAAAFMYKFFTICSILGIFFFAGFVSEKLHRQ